LNDKACGKVYVPKKTGAIVSFAENTVYLLMPDLHDYYYNHCYKELGCGPQISVNNCGNCKLFIVTTNSDKIKGAGQKLALQPGESVRVQGFGETWVAIS